MTNLVRSSALKCYCPHHGWKISETFRSIDIPWRFHVARCGSPECSRGSGVESRRNLRCNRMPPGQKKRCRNSATPPAKFCQISSEFCRHCLQPRHPTSSSKGPITAVTAHTASFDPVFAEFVPGDSSKLHKAAQISNSSKVDSWRGLCFEASSQSSKCSLPFWHFWPALVRCLTDSQLISVPLLPRVAISVSWTAGLWALDLVPRKSRNFLKHQNVLSAPWQGTIWLFHVVAIRGAATLGTVELVEELVELVEVVVFRCVSFAWCDLVEVLVGYIPQQRAQPVTLK